MATTTSLRLWRITPLAAPDDPYWQDRPIWLSVVVRAATAAEARVMAERLARDRLDPAGDLERADLGGGFDSEKLYRVTALEGPDAAEWGDGEPGILRAVRAEAPTGPTGRP